MQIGGFELSSTAKKTIFLVVLIFILAFGIRAHLMKYDLIFGFDSYWHARITSYVIDSYEVPDNDPLAYYQIGGAPIRKVTWFFWYFSAAIYKVFSFPLTLGAYNRDVWIWFVKVLPALFGALISVAMFFLGKEMYDYKAGFAMGIFAATIPAFVYRTMAGFFEEDSLGFLWLVIGFVFLFRALKDPEWKMSNIKNAVLAGIFFSIMALTWDLFLIIPLILVAYFFTSIPLMYIREKTKKIRNARIINFVKLFAIAFIIFGVIATVNDTGIWVNKTINYVAQYAPISGDNLERLTSKGSSVLSQTIGEENTGWQFFGQKYNALIIFVFLMPFFFIWRMYHNKKEHYSLIILIWLILTFFMAWNKLKFTYTLGLPIAASAGLVFGEAFKIMSKRNSTEKKFFGVLVALMLLIGVGIGTFFVTTNVPTIEEMGGWKDSLLWMRDNTPTDAKFLNWWDTGHHITFVGERAVMEDNSNFSYEADQDTGRFFLSETEDNAMKIINKYGSTHVIMEEDTLMKGISFAFYANDTTDQSDPRIYRYSRGGTIIPCSKIQKPLSSEISYQCGANNFNEQIMNSFRTDWTEIPSQIEQGRIPLFIYRNSDNSKLYVLSSAINKSMIGRLWFDDPSLKNFKVIYNKRGVKMFEVV